MKPAKKTAAKAKAPAKPAKKAAKPAAKPVKKAAAKAKPVKKAAAKVAKKAVKAVKAVKAERPARRGAAFVAVRPDGAVLLRKRAETGLLGGMAEIWDVSHPDHTVPLVMKIPLILDGDDPTMIVGFEQEQMILPRLTGPHVPRCLALGDFSAQPYIVMERVAGGAAGRLITKNTLPPLVAARLVHAGAGLKASPRWTSSRGMGRALRRLLDEPAFAARSAELGQAIRQAGGTDRAVALIEGVLRSAPPGIAHVA